MAAKLRYVTYRRVSTAEQGRSGLGLEAQERDIILFLERFSPVPYELIGEYVDVQSGGDDSRPELDKALALVRRTGAELLVAKLDRLSRRVAFISALMEDAKVKLRVACMPHASKFELHLWSALAEQERLFVSERTKAALGAAKARGVKLGGLRPGTMERAQAVKLQADGHAAKAMKIIRPLIEAGSSMSGIARTLDEMGIATARGGRWTAMQVSRIIDRTMA
jgi:DNA invertase Pin-like site-specific DNA recombinase